MFMCFARVSGHQEAAASRRREGAYLVSSAPRARLNLSYIHTQTCLHCTQGARRPRFGCCHKGGSWEGTCGHGKSHSWKQSAAHCHAPRHLASHCVHVTHGAQASSSASDPPGQPTAADAARCREGGVERFTHFNWRATSMYRSPPIEVAGLTSCNSSLKMAWWAWETKFLGLGAHRVLGLCGDHPF